MTIIKSIIIAFSMFSRIPMPKVEWDSKSMKFMMAAFPLIGILCGALVYGWIGLCEAFSLGDFLRATGLTLIPLALSGGIHMDGFADTIDALSSHGERDKKLKILSDPHSGAFAVMGITSYMVIMLGLFTELKITKEAVFTLFFIYGLSRALSGFAVSIFPCAKSSGLVHTFSDGAAKRNVRLILILEIMALIFAMIVFGKAMGAAAVLASLVVMAYYYRMSLREFGGITGDLAGWFLSMAEIAMVLAIVAAQKLI